MRPSDLLRETLIPMFMRNVTPAMLFGSRIEEILEFPLPDPSTYDFPFHTFNELQMLSFQICNASALFVRKLATKVFVKTPLTQEDFAQQSRLLEAHHLWFQALQKLECSKILTQEEHIMAASLKMRYHSMYVLVDCSMSLRQTDFDRHLQSFHEINRNAKIILGSMGLVKPVLSSFSGSRKGPGNPRAYDPDSTPRAGEASSITHPERKYSQLFRRAFHFRDLCHSAPALCCHPLPLPHHAPRSCRPSRNEPTARGALGRRDAHCSRQTRN